MSTAGCHCFDLYELDGFLCMEDHWSPRLSEILQFFSLAYVKDRLEMKLGPSKPLFHSHFNAEGTKKRNAPSAALKGGGGGGNEKLQYHIRDKDQNETLQTNKDLC